MQLQLLFSGLSSNVKSFGPRCQAVIIHCFNIYSHIVGMSGLDVCELSDVHFSVF